MTLLTLLNAAEAHTITNTFISQSTVARCVEIEFTDGVWTDVTNYVFHNGGVEWHVGRSSRLDKFQAGGCTVTFDNSDRRFDPEYTSSPYYPNIQPGKRIRVRTQSAGADNWMFTGKIDDWPQTYNNPSIGICACTATDAFGELAKIDLGDAPFFTEVQRSKPSSWWQLNET